MSKPWLADKLLLATHCYVARGDNSKEKRSFNPFFGETDIERRSNFEKFLSCLFVETYITLRTHFVQMCQ
jgi:hypothetical protein